MLTTRWQPYAELWNEMADFQREMNQLFQSYGLGRAGWPRLAAAYPGLNVWEEGDTVYAEAELPGMDLGDLEIYVTGGTQLTLKGQRKQPAFEKGVWHRQERGFGSFTRVITLPVDVDADKVEAKLRNGVLTIAMPKSEAARPRKITVKAD
jgi:HSP20 family protein